MKKKPRRDLPMDFCGVPKLMAEGEWPADYPEMPAGFIEALQRIGDGPTLEDHMRRAEQAVAASEPRDGE